MACNDCPEITQNPDEGCLSPSVSSCITYDGNDIDCADISSGQSLNQVIEQLANNDCGLQEQIEDIVDNMEELSGNVNNLQDDLEELSGSVQTQIDNIITFTCQDLSGCSIDNLLDVDVSPVSGDNLVFNGIKWINYTPEEKYQFSCQELSGCNIGSLGNVIESTPVSGQCLIYNGTNWVNVNLSIPNAFQCSDLNACSINSLGNVDTTPVSGDLLMYNGSQWTDVPQSAITDPLYDEIDILSTRLDIVENALILINSRLDDCCVSGSLDVDFSDSIIDICFQDSTPGKLFGTIHLSGSGGDFNGFDGITMATVYVSDATNPSNTTKTVAYIPKLTGSNPSFDIQLLDTQGDPINTSVGGSTRTISFVSRFKDMDNNIHFVTLTANIPLLNNTDCVNGQSVTFTVDDF